MWDIWVNDKKWQKPKKNDVFVLFFTLTKGIKISS